MKDKLTVGRDYSCDIKVGDPYVSRVHSYISLTEDGSAYIYENVGKNGSTIDGVEVTEKVVVKPGIDIKLCGRVSLPWSDIYLMLPLNESK